MTKIVVPLLIAAIVSGASSAQTFEVASVKPAAPVQQGEGAIRRKSIGVRSIDPQQFRETNVTLKRLLAEAYAVKIHQIDGPAWLDDQRYDVVAKLPDGSAKEQIPAMLQNLLTERFLLKAHDEIRQDHVLALVVGKTGPRLQASASETQDEGSSASFFANGHMKFSRYTVAAFADTLSNLLASPVLDMTQIPGHFDITLDVSRRELAGLKVAGVPQGEGDSSASIFTAIQELGLKLESRTEPIRHIVVDSAQKTPIGN